MPRGVLLRGRSNSAATLPGNPNPNPNPMSTPASRAIALPLPLTLLLQGWEGGPRGVQPGCRGVLHHVPADYY